jgi:putative phosphoesterase
LIAVLVADTHGNSVTQLAREIENRTKPDLLIFAGDYYRDALALGRKLSVPTKAVAGNCDSIKGLQEETFDLVGVRILLTHGHSYRVKTTLLPLKLRAAEVRADVVVFGHTHVAGCEQVDGVWFINPGSPSFPRNHQKTFGVLEISGNGVKPSLITV